MGDGTTRRRTLRIAGLLGALAGPAVGSATGQPGVPTEHTLMITGNGPVEYALEVDGSLEFVTEGGDYSAESDETVTGSAVRTATDTTGSTGEQVGRTYLGDRYRFTGSIERFDLDPDPVTGPVLVYLDERREPVQAVEGISGWTDETHSLMVVADGPVDYRIVVDGSLEADTEGGDFSAEPGDSMGRGTLGNPLVTDRTGAGDDVANDLTYMGDRFRFRGSVERLDLDPASVTGDVNVYLDERVVRRQYVLNL